MEQTEKFPYVLVPGKLKKFFQHIQTSGVPQKVSSAYLEKAGFKSRNDRAIITTLRFVGLLDNDRVPTRLWSEYRQKSKGPAVLASALRSSYAGLFLMYPEAYGQAAESLRDYFAGETKLGDVATKAMAWTFRAMCELADFEAAAPPTDRLPGPKPTREATHGVPGEAAPLTINLNVQLSIPESSDPRVYENFFKAMREHLLTP